MLIPRAWCPVLLGLLLCWNLVVLLLYGADKRKARRGRWRVAEGTLLLCAFLGGGIGAAAGMGLLRHKTRHLRFRLLVPVACLLTLALLGWIGWSWLGW